ncbi:MAG: DUF2029 domain-containing protein [Alphaproteobacteria bacterium]|nr:DUF2029 domain-containing protein [Alphaproteobacteria bacterium]
MALYLLIGGWWLLTGPGLLDRAGKPLGGDFVTFYAASEMVLRGEAAAVFDLPTLHAVEQAVIGAPIERFAWHYPPVALLGVAPLALLPFGLALALTTLLSLALYVGTLRRIDRGPVVMGLALAFPGLFQNLLHGQNGCVSAALIGLGLLEVDRRPLLGGALLGLMVYKPHLAPALVVALLAGRRWAALGAMATSALTACGLSLLALGQAPWAAFVDNLPFAQAVLYQGGVPWEKMPTVSAMLLLLGLPELPVRVAQLGVSALAALGVAWLWARDARPALRCAGAAFAALLATPFAFEYDLVILAVPMAWLGVVGQETGWRRGEVPLLALAWVLPIAAPGVAGLTGLQLGPLVLAALLLLTLQRSRP